MKKTKSTSSETEREAFLKQANEAYAKMKENPQEWQEHLEEIALWETTLADGLEDEETTFEPGNTTT
jgi:hypothetical protein